MRPVLQTLPHLVRNAVDHGVEPGPARGAKPEEGRIEVAVSATAETYSVRVADDGAGLDLDSIGARALALGIVDATALGEMTDDEVFRENIRPLAPDRERDGVSVLVGQRPEDVVRDLISSEPACGG